MNNQPSHRNQSNTTQTDCSLDLHFGFRSVQPWKIYSLLGLLTVVMFLLFGYLNKNFESHGQYFAFSLAYSKASKEPGGEDAADLISKLKYHGLWKLPSSGKIPPFFIKTYPVDLYTINDINVRKRVFLHSLLPQALLVRQEALQRRARLETVLSMIDCPLEKLDFSMESQGQCYWRNSVAEEDIKFIRNLCARYRTSSAKELLERVNAVPTSIILAQGALESSWGASRFTREGNSIFGMWTWKTAGITPARREEGKTHRVKIYDSILDSVRAYQLTLNRFEPYDQFRQLRLQTDDPLILANGLSSYSERGEEYVAEIKKIITSNDLQKYDKCFLTTDMTPPQYLKSAPASISSDKPKRASM
jgi:Bax protein